MSKESMLRNTVMQMENLYKTIDRHMESARKKVNPPCAKLCDHCCYQLVTATVPEAIIALRTIRKDQKACEHFRENISLLLYDVEQLHKSDASNRSWFAQHVPCIFLKDRLCTIYDDRPVVCRSQMTAEDTADKCKNDGETHKLKLLDKLPYIKEGVHTARRLADETQMPWGTYPFQLSLLRAWEIYEHGITVKLTTTDELNEMAYWAQLEIRP